MEIILLVVVLALVIVFVTRPFAEVWHPQAELEPASLSLLSERERILAALQELDFDHSLGKIPTEQYVLRRADLVDHGAQVLRRLDESRHAQISVQEQDLDEKPAKPERQKPVHSATSLSDAALEKMIAERRALREKKK